MTATVPSSHQGTDRPIDGDVIAPLQEGARLARPIVFNRFGGFFHEGAVRSRIAVLMLSPYGYEELCVRRSWRILADGIADAGMPCLRFDYPGTGDALDPDIAPAGLEDWSAAAREAACYLRQRTGCFHLVLLGQGLGGALAAELAATIDAVDATVLMAPVISGRSYLREMRAWAKVMTDGFGLPADDDETGGLTIAGLHLPGARAEAIKAIDLAKLDRAPGREVLLLTRPHMPAPKAFLGRLAGLGTMVTALDYEGYEALLTDPTEARPPLATVRSIVGWLEALTTRIPPRLPAAPGGDMREAAALSGDGFAETPVRFGNGLFGVLCRPSGLTGAAPVVFVNAGRDYHIGWGRSAVNQARALARAGVPSLRFDIRGIGDSPEDGDDSEMLYSLRQMADVRSAIDHFEGLGHPKVRLIGRCSGAYAAFNMAADDARVSGIVLINTARLIWNPGETVAEAMKFAQRSVADFGATLLWRDGLRRLLSGQLRVRGAAGFLLRKLAMQLGRHLAHVPGNPSVQSRLAHEVHRRFRVLRDRKVPVTLIYSVGDTSLDELRSFMGKRLQRLARYANVGVVHVPDADHNFTPRSAQSELIGHLVDQLGRPRSDGPCVLRSKSA